jgi:hypothetical protein
MRTGAYLIVVTQVPVPQAPSPQASGRFLEYSHFRAIELAFNSWRGVNELRSNVVREPSGSG